MKNEEQQIESEPHYSLFKGPTPVFSCEPRIVQTYALNPLHFN